jgi:septum site-determining protein MinC
MTNHFPIKGYKDGLLITVGDGDWVKVQRALIDQIKEKEDFFNGARVTLDVGERALRAAELGTLRDSLSEQGVALFALLSRSASTEAVAETLGLSTRKSILQGDAAGIGKAVFGGEPALLIRHTLRSGHSVKYDGHIIIEGDVNPGAEIVATGSIYVWGKLLGSASAGINGSEDEVICSLQLNPQLMRIADITHTTGKPIVKLKKHPEKAILKDNVLKIIEWDKKSV